MLSSITWVSAVCLVVAYTGWIPPDSHNLLLESESTGRLQESTPPFVAEQSEETSRNSEVLSKEQHADTHTEIRTSSCPCGDNAGELYENSNFTALRTSAKKFHLSCMGHLGARLINSFRFMSSPITDNNISGVNDLHVTSAHFPLSQSPDVTFTECCLHAEHFFFYLGLGTPVFPYMIMAYVKGRRRTLGENISQVNQELYPEFSNAKTLTTSDLFLPALDGKMCEM